MNHFFPANNTSEGFINYFDSITSPWENINRIYILKGGPGVGKNTFMHKLDEKAREKGYSIEYYHCASDCESLDAIKIPELGIMMVDGTAPHIIDPLFPGAVDNIINLGIYLDEKALEKRVDDIKMCQKRNSICYKKAFSYLKAAGAIEENTDFLYKTVTDTGDLRGIAKGITDDLKASGKNGYVRKLFASAYSPQGYINYIDTIAENKNVIKLNGPSVVSAEFIDFIIQYCKYEGINCEVFYSSLMPKKAQHMVIPEFNLCITSDEKIEGDRIIDLNKTVDKKMLDRAAVEFNEAETNKLVYEAVKCLKHAKSVHDDIEAIYKENMDFEQSTIYIDSFLKNLF